MAIEQLLESCPDYARDLKLNMANVLTQAELTEQQSWGTAVACAIASRSSRLTAAILADAGAHLSESALFAAKAAAALMGMNNVFYRFRHLSGNPAYNTMPARLRMQLIRMHGGDPVDFELWCLAVSAVNACGACIEAHGHALAEKAFTEDKILAAVRIASTIHALAAVFDAEEAVAAKA
jgi:lipoyl-dependent peroxiredoxin subunit D